MLYIGIDLGTSSVKLLLMDAAGNVKNIVSREYPLYFPNPGWSEQKPEDWYKETMQGLKELLEGFPKEEVAGISFGGQMHGLVILDDKDEVIRPAILCHIRSCRIHRHANKSGPRIRVIVRGPLPHQIRQIVYMVFAKFCDRFLLFFVIFGSDDLIHPPFVTGRCG